ncbi:bifunctional phosphopantothenoylcysteine decarboxylase/phosphopantothenate--cysteine ligase CoaBC [Sphingobacterium sp. lm-10]|uniref:bifunctional phosphopantothenoylcysteine decarboxylase/phosphopantothenate--cysteine ligase CoaBC n=1 Tax=Sphingobacterium sp. lm-10 TaxID=2944904 RepID=UPI00201FB425|nr:bifunctional phosphopantothenoylcysteine decarboxylase/phosphopantothenate--cysteine ligase CoaBC [Sphingobacterium sp. lm-10]MCL7988382.1 bifunctional phosphopantothenoylcysteine decarboxylase/phosphopantothenate--cysteine ligase CoaBC [Sphingobacterium sp. lm-10]
MSLQGKHIVLGVCGSIAAYKSALIVRLLIHEGASVRVIMTPDATEFITPLTLATLSKQPVSVDYFDPKTGEWSNHIQIGLDADLLLIAPASANTLAKMANGLCDNLLTAVYLSAKCPVYIAPAMDLDMWKHPATKRNIALLQSYGNQIIPPGNGELASGLSGEGRLAEPEDIISFLQQQSRNDSKQQPLLHVNALVTAGPTYEAIDPVRFIGNHSSGKMGYAIARRLQNLGATVTLISGPSHEIVPLGVDIIKVHSAAEMLAACQHHFESSEIVVMSAAVADYTPSEYTDQKIKKKEDVLSLSLTRTTDILATLGQQKTAQQTLVGFALETNDELANAKSKLARKNLDFIVLNSTNDAGAGFSTDTNHITIIERDGQEHRYELKSKDDVASDICDRILAHRNTL